MHPISGTIHCTLLTSNLWLVGSSSTSIFQIFMERHKPCYMGLSPDSVQLIFSSRASDCELKFGSYYYLTVLTGKLQFHLLTWNYVCVKVLQKVTGVQRSLWKIGFLDFQDFQQTSQPTTPWWKSVGHCNSISLGLRLNVPPLPYYHSWNWLVWITEQCQRIFLYLLFLPTWR